MSWGEFISYLWYFHWSCLDLSCFKSSTILSYYYRLNCTSLPSLYSYWRIHPLSFLCKAIPNSPWYIGSYLPDNGISLFTIATQIRQAILIKQRIINFDLHFWDKSWFDKSNLICSIPAYTFLWFVSSIHYWTKQTSLYCWLVYDNAILLVVACKNRSRDYSI